MKSSYLLAAITACALSSIPFASAEDKAASASPAVEKPVDAQTSAMQSSMTAMQAQMDQISATTDPKQRQTLMRAHMQSMQESMAMMRSTSKPMKMSGGPRDGMGAGADKGMPADKGMMGGGMMQHHQRMETRMEMMQMLMDQMLQHQHAMESVPAR